MTIPEIDQVEKTLDNLTQDLHKTNFQKFVSVYAEEIQALEVALIVLADQKSIDLASGIWLDYLGKIVGEDRLGRTDEEYRTALRLRIAINTADSTPNTIINLVTQFTEATDVAIAEGSLAWLSLYTNGNVNISADLWQLVEDIKAAGVRVIINSDVTSRAFRPSWELSSDGPSVVYYEPSSGRDKLNSDQKILEVLEVFDGVSFSPLLVDDGTGFSELEINIETQYGTYTHYPITHPQIIQDFAITTDLGQEDFDITTDSGPQTLAIVTQPEIYESRLCWEVTSESNELSIDKLY